MKHSNFKKMLSVIGVIVLIAAMALNITGCGSKEEASAAAPAQTGAPVEMTVMGEGAKVFYFIAEDLDGIETKFEIHTDAEFVGEALIAHGLIAGDAGDYGLYVKTVNGITLDWDRDAKYWSFLIDGEYAMTGADMTQIVDAATYSFVPAE